MNKIHPYIFVIFLLGLPACSGNRQHESTRQEQHDDDNGRQYRPVDLRYDSVNKTISFKEIKNDTLNRTIRLLIH